MKTNKFVWCVTMAAALTTWATVSHATLVGYWNFNEGTGQTAADLSGFSNNGALGVNGTTETTDPTWTVSGGGHTGVAGDSALSFDGTNNQKVTVPDANSLDIGSTGWNDAMTISAWVKPGPNPNNAYSIAGKYAGGLPGNFQYYFLLNQPVVGFSDAVSTGTYTFYGASGAAIPIGVWDQMAVVLQENGANSTLATFYLNGVQYGTTQTTSFNFAQTTAFALTLGNRGDTAWQLNGSLDDVAIWNHALNPAQIAQLGAGTRSVLDIVPEPSTVLLLGLGGWLVALRSRRNRRIE